MHHKTVSRSSLAHAVSFTPSAKIARIAGVSAIITAQTNPEASHRDQSMHSSRRANNTAKNATKR